MNAICQCNLVQTSTKPFYKEKKKKFFFPIPRPIVWEIVLFLKGLVSTFSCKTNIFFLRTKMGYIYWYFGNVSFLWKQVPPRSLRFISAIYWQELLYSSGWMRVCRFMQGWLEVIKSKILSNAIDTCFLI